MYFLYFLYSINFCLTQFYEALGLSPEELKVKMDECSKHRSKFAPVDDTPPGKDIDSVLCVLNY